MCFASVLRGKSERIIYSTKWRTCHTLSLCMYAISISNFSLIPSNPVFTLSFPAREPFKWLRSAAVYSNDDGNANLCGTIDSCLFILTNSDSFFFLLRSKSSKWKWINSAIYSHCAYCLVAFLLFFALNIPMIKCKLRWLLFIGHFNFHSLKQFLNFFSISANFTYI